MAIICAACGYDLTPPELEARVVERVAEVHHDLPGLFAGTADDIQRPRAIAAHLLRRDVDARLAGELVRCWARAHLPRLAAGAVEAALELAARAELARRRAGGRS